MSSQPEESNDEKVVNYFRLKQDYFEERKKIISKLYKKTKFVESTNEKKRRGNFLIRDKNHFFISIWFFYFKLQLQKNFEPFFASLLTFFAANSFRFWSAFVRIGLID